MRADAFQNRILSFDSFILMRIPVLLELTTCLLINLLLNVEFSLVKDVDVVGKDCHLNLRPLCTIERRLPALDEEPRDHNIVTWLD